MTMANAESAWKKHLVGWQTGLVVLAFAGAGLLLGTPRTVAPLELPLPVANTRVLAQLAERDQQRARELTQTDDVVRAGKGYDVRQAGESFRRFGEADVRRDYNAAATHRQALLVTLQNLLQQPAGPDAILAFRAYELSVFLREIAHWEATGEPTPELAEVGGDFLALIERSDWRQAPHRLLLPPVVQAVLFKKRFGEITSLKLPPFALEPDEIRVLYAFLLAHPPRVLPGSVGGAEDARALWEWRLHKVDELQTLDPTYPAEFARGIACYHLGDARRAVVSFREHLARYPDGPYTLRARNHLLAALTLEL